MRSVTVVVSIGRPSEVVRIGAVQVSFIDPVHLWHEHTRNSGSGEDHTDEC